MHAKRDRLANFDQGLRMKSAFERNKKPFEWLVLDGSSQDAAQDRARAYETLLVFLQRHLPVPPQ